MKPIYLAFAAVFCFAMGTTASADHPKGSLLEGEWKSNESGHYHIHDVETHGKMDTFHYTRKAEVERGQGIVTCVGAGVYDRVNGLVHAKSVCPTKHKGWNWVSHTSWRLRLEGTHPHLAGDRSEQYIGNIGNHRPSLHGHPHEHHEKLHKVAAGGPGGEPGGGGSPGGEPGRR